MSPVIPPVEVEEGSVGKATAVAALAAAVEGSESRRKAAPVSAGCVQVAAGGVDRESEGAVAAGKEFVVVPVWALDSLTGPGNRLEPGSSAAVAGGWVAPAAGDMETGWPGV